MTMAMEALPCFPVQSALTWGHGEPSVIPTEKTFVNVVPPRESLRRLRTTPGRLEKHIAAFNSNEEAEQEIQSILPPFLAEPTSMWAQPIELHKDFTQHAWTNSPPGPMRGALDRLSTEALRENLLKGVMDFGSCQEPWKVDESPKAPMREALDWLSTEALREKMLEGAVDFGICQEPWKVNEVEPTLLWAQPVETSSSEAPMREALDQLSTECLREKLLEGVMDVGICQEPWKIDKVQTALPLGRTETSRAPLTNNEQNVPKLEEPRRLNTTLGRLGGSSGKHDDITTFSKNEETETKEASTLIPSSADPTLIWAQTVEQHTPSRGALDRLSTEALREHFLERGLAPESCQDPWRVGGDTFPTEQLGMPGCAMLPMFPTGIPAMDQLIPPACSAPDVFTTSAFTNMTSMSTWAPPAPLLEWQNSVTTGVSRFHFQASVNKLKTRDRTIVLDQFEFPLCGENVPFRIQITAKKVHDRKHGQCFQTARGKGNLELKCEGVPPKNSEPVKFCFIVGSGYNVQAKGPVTHNFFLNSVAKLPADQQEWDFIALMDQTTMTVSVCIEVATDLA